MKRHFVPALGWSHEKREGEKERKKKLLTTFDSEPMGSDAHIRRMQPWSSGMLHALLFPISSVIAEAPKIRHSVSIRHLSV